MTDLALISIGVDSRPLKQGTADLAAFGAAAARTDRAVTEAGSAIAAAGRRFGGVGSIAQELGRDVGAMVHRFDDSVGAVRRFADAADDVGSAFRRLDGRLALQQLSQVAQQATATGDVLMAVSIQAADFGAVFGPLGIAIGAATGVLLPLAYNLLSAGDAAEEAKTRTEELAEAFEGAHDAIARADEALALAASGGAEDLERIYGTVTQRVRDLQQALAQIEVRAAAQEVANSLRMVFDEDFRASLETTIGGVMGEIASATSDEIGAQVAALQTEIRGIEAAVPLLDGWDLQNAKAQVVAIREEIAALQGDLAGAGTLSDVFTVDPATVNRVRELAEMIPAALEDGLSSASEARAVADQIAELTGLLGQLGVESSDAFVEGTTRAQDVLLRFANTLDQAAAGAQGAGGSFNGFGSSLSGVSDAAFQAIPPMEELRAEYGAQAEAIQRVLEAQNALAVAQQGSGFQALVGEVRGVVAGLEEAGTASGTLVLALQEASQAGSLVQQADAAFVLAQELAAAAGGAEVLSGEALAAYQALLDASGGAAELQAQINAAHGAALGLSGAVGAIAGAFGPAISAASMLASLLSGVLGQINGILGAIPGLQAAGEAFRGVAGTVSTLWDRATSGGATGQGLAGALGRGFDGALDNLRSLWGQAQQTGTSIDELSDSLTDMTKAAVGGSGGSGGGGGGAAGAADRLSDAFDAIIAAMPDATKEAVAFNAALYDAGLTAEEVGERKAQILIGGIDDMASAWGDFVVGGFRDFQGFVGSVLDSFRSMLSQMIAMAARNRIMVSLGIGGAGGLGAANIAQGLGGGGGLIGGIGGFLGNIGTGFGSVVSGFLSGGFGGAGAAISQGLSAASSGLAGLGTAIGAIAAPITAAIGLFSLFKGKTETLETGLGVAIKGLDDLTAWTWKVTETSRLGGLLKSTSSDVADADPALVGALDKAFGQVSGSVLGLAKSLGIGAEAFEKFAFNIEFQTQGMSDEQIQQELLERLQAASDAMARMTGITARMKHDGESATETLARLSATLPVVNDAFDLLGFKLYDLGIQGAASAARMADVFGGLEGFQQGIGFYTEAFFSAGERARMATRQFHQGLRDINVSANLRTIDAFRDKVDALMEQGRDVAAAGLIALAPLFKSILDLKAEARGLDDLDLGPVDRGADRAALRDEREGLLRELWELRGEEDKLRRMELKALEPANRALQKQIWQWQDLREAVEGFDPSDFASRIDFERTVSNATSALGGGGRQDARAESGGNRLREERERVRERAEAERHRQMRDLLIKIEDATDRAARTLRKLDKIGIAERE